MSTAFVDECLGTGNVAHHSTKYALDGSRRVRAVDIADFETPDKYHYTCQIPAELMRRIPTSFHNFHDSNQAQAVMHAFHWFLDFMQEMISYKAKKDALRPGAGVLAFVEWCPSAASTKKLLATAGWRLHVFVDRNVNEMTVFWIFFDKLKKKIAKLQSSNKPVPPHYHINTPAQYGSRVYEPYKGDICNFEELLNADQTAPTAAPSNLFQMTELDGCIFPIEAYWNESGGFQFPSSHFLKLDPEQVSFEKFAKRKLPDYMLHTMAKPEIIIYSDPVLRVEFSPHCMYEDFSLDPRYKPGDVWEQEGVANLIADKRDKCLIWEAGNTYTSIGFGDITYNKKLHACKSLINYLDPSQLTGPASAEYSKMLQRQAAISTLDSIKLSAIEREATGQFSNREEKQQFILHEFTTRVWEDPQAFVSDPIKLVLRWFAKEFNPATIVPIKLKHTSMSVFGHRACDLMMVYHTLYQVASAHRECYWVLTARLDAFRHEHKLHLNAMFVGDAATSKSFLQQQLELNSVGLTAKTLTYQTSKAGAVDHDDNHFVRLFDEVPAAFLKDPKNKVDEPALKMKLVEQLVSHERPHIDEETGVRTKKTGLSSCIDVIIGASNESRLAFTDALRTRFHWFESEKTMSENSIRKCQQAMRTMKAEQKHKQRSEIASHQFEQGYACLVWQFIRMGAIEKPDTSIIGLIMERFGVELNTYGIKMDTREWERVQMLAVNLSIMRAKQILYCTVTGKYANVDHFHPEQILDAEPYLICTEEIVLHAIGLEFDSVVPKSQRKILPAIWEMHKRNPAYMIAGADADPNYIELSGTLNQVGKKIAGVLQQSKKHCSLENIKACLKDMGKDMQIKCQVYKANGTAGKYHDSFPENDLNDGVLQNFDQLIQVGNKISIHIHMFSEIRLGIKTDVYKNCVLKLRQKFTARKKIVLGSNLAEEPQFWNTVDYAPATERVSMQVGPAQQHPAYSELLGHQSEQSQFEIEEDLDVYAARQRSKKVGYHIEPYVPDNADWGENTYNYPLRVTSTGTPTKRKHEEIEDDDDDDEMMDDL